MVEIRKTGVFALSSSEGANSSFSWPVATRSLKCSGRRYAQQPPQSEIAVTIGEFMRGYKVAWERHNPAMPAAPFLPDGQYHNTPRQIGSI